MFSSLEVGLKKSSCFNKRKQCFALFIDDSLSEKDAFLKSTDMFHFCNDYFLKKTDYPFVLTLENASSFGGSTENISRWKKRGVIMASLTWNFENSLAGGVKSKKGLTAFGKSAIKEMENEKIIVDVSHLNEKSFSDFLSVSRKPFAASHSNCYSICKNERNLKDWQIKEIVSSSGIIGLNFYPLFLGNGFVFENIYKNIIYLLKFGAEDNIAIGSDFDGAKMSVFLNSDKKVIHLYNFLRLKGLEKSILEKIFFKNAENFFNNVLQVK